MLRVNRYMALAFVVTMSTGVASGENHPSSFGQYSTAVNESRLFIEDSGLTTLRCDLSFSSAEHNQAIVAPKGSVVSQTVPAFVWQYSGLLPVSDYLKTVAIHSVGSESKESAWQDVQLAFYNGLRVEGVREADAKIAYAGAYAFAPRWPLVELIGITDPKMDANSKLFKVGVTPADPKGISVGDYQTLAQDILSAPEQISLQDIRGVIDAADAAKEMTAEVVGGSINDLFASNREPAKEDATQESLPQPVIEKGGELLPGTSIDDLFKDDAILPAAAESQVVETPVESVEVEIPQIDVLATTPEVIEESDKAILGPEDPLLSIDVIIEDEVESGQQTSVTVDPSLGAQPNVWKTLPDGSVVLLQVEG